MFAQLPKKSFIACMLALTGIGSVYAQDVKAEDSVELNSIEVWGQRKNNPFSQSNSNAYINKEELERYTPISVGDMLKGQVGVSVGDSRNGGGLDVNIRGAQGQSRVGVTVDGGEQMVNVYRGYSGTQQRSYVDPDLIRSVEIE